MPLVKYVANADSGDGTGSIRLKSGENGQPRELVLGGEPLALDDHEYAGLQGRFVLEVVNTAPAETVSVVSAVEVPEQPFELTPPVVSSTLGVSSVLSPSSPSTTPTEGS